MELPKTRQACIEKYNLRRQMYLPLTKLDMYLGGMICCSEDEFLYRKPEGDEDELTGGDWPCLCVCEDSDSCGVLSCVEATDKTLHLPWDAPLYDEPPKCQNETA